MCKFVRHGEHERMPTHRSMARPSLSILDLGSLLFLGAVWGAAFLFLLIASRQIGPVWAAEIRIALGAAVLVCWRSPSVSACSPASG
jgi:hypothetical protein